ncbi:Factor arrest protein 11 [Recurvomyces mirabilis]|nr:Factor arrest protein 11 [Recurvomyces mirabilis]
MDEVENPDLPAAGESSPTIRPIDQEENDDSSPVDKPSIADAKSEAPVDSANPSPITQPTPPSTTTRPAAPSRPVLKRETSAPPPQQSPPAPPTQYLESPDFSSDPPDSLTLADLKRIRSTFPNIQPPPKQEILDHDQVYDFKYQDAQSFPVELEEWFTYSTEEELRLRKCKVIFNQVWRADEVGGGFDWTEVGDEVRRSFLEREMESLRVTRGMSTTSLMIMVYLALGCWEETAGRQAEVELEGLFPGGDAGGGRLDDYKASEVQLQWIVKMVKLMHECGGLKVVYECLQTFFDQSFAASPLEQSMRNEAQPRRGEESMELWCCLTLMYLFIEIARTTEGADGKALKQDILALEPKLINFLTQITAKLRWDDVAPVPLTKMLLLAWKTILVTFGGIAEVEHVKASLRKNSTTEEEEKDQRGQPVITASPLDYHLFRQEISSKYPAYQPPLPTFPLEPENNSILPPLKHRQPSYSSADSTFGGAPAVGAPSIMHQPVHIATPAPSPPPSPAGPGKAGKKQNYQTNQMFPFLYPPLDESSSELGGKGSTSLQDALVGRKWEGSDVPSSILEAAELFAKRMRATRGMRQLWGARVEFMRFERGWKGVGDKDHEETDEDVEGFELLSKPAPEETAEQGAPLSSDPAGQRTDEQKKLDAVRDYYRDSLPHLQSLVIVLLKAVLHSVTDLVTKNNGQNGLQAGIQFNDPTNGLPNGSMKPQENGMHNGDGIENTAEEMDKLRTQEIAAKALSAILLLLLKWFKLLLDSNYVPLVLKLWQTQEIGRAVHFRVEREEREFFGWCGINGRRKSPGTRAGDGDGGDYGIGENVEVIEGEESEDEAAPPPIRRNRERDQQASDPSSAVLSPDDMMLEDPAGILQADGTTPIHPPEVDELGYPTTPLPPSPLRNYSWRNLFTSLNHLRILQKVTRRKTHRALLLVSYKSSNHLKKTLKIPVHALRLYTLKLFKTQVPFCGRKWRQGNMKVITAVWLSVPAELRDDWLSGGGGGMGGACVGDVDGTVEDALPLEQGLRSLTHWWNVRNFPAAMGVDGAGIGDGVAGLEGLEEREGGWFERELERMGVLGLGGGQGEEGSEEFGMEEEGGMREDGGAGWGGPIEGY